MISLPMAKKPQGEWKARFRAVRFRDLAAAPEGVKIKNAEPLDHTPRALQAVEFFRTDNNA